MKSRDQFDAEEIAEYFMDLTFVFKTGFGRLIIKPAWTTKRNIRI